MSNVVNLLTEMGFPKVRIELAMAKTGSKDLQLVMDWMLSHEEELDRAPPAPAAVPLIVPAERELEAAQAVAPAETPAPSKSPAPSKTPPPSESAPSETATSATVTETPALEEPAIETKESDNLAASASAQSVICDDCNKVFKTTAEVEYHAAKSGHENFSESAEEKKPLTEEEKKEQLAKIEAKLKQRRLEREAREKEEALEKEKIRIKSGKEILEAKKKHEEMEIKKIILQKKKEKEDKRVARLRVKEQIEADKLARKIKFGDGTAAPANEPADVPAKVPDSIPEKKPAQIYTEVKLQIRLSDGKTLVQNFGIKEPLSAVRLFVEMNQLEGPFKLMTSFPRKVFTSEDYEKPLEALGLAPTATLIVTKC